MKVSSGTYKRVQHCFLFNWCTHSRQTRTPMLNILSKVYRNCLQDQTEKCFSVMGESLSLFNVSSKEFGKINSWAGNCKFGPSTEKANTYLFLSSNKHDSRPTHLRDLASSFLANNKCPSEGDITGPTANVQIKQKAVYLKRFFFFWNLTGWINNQRKSNSVQLHYSTYIIHIFCFPSLLSLYFSFY